MAVNREIEHVREYSGQVLKLTYDITRALTELNKNLGRLPKIAEEAYAADDLARRERVLAEREHGVKMREWAVAEQEREMKARFAKAEALLAEDG